ncbi:sensor histidine kinase [Novosphingobium terrae]|uniref:sensor histidine kinase n=1 Tax=Novosphingobium terrae TaxID=2726189 RepID=UPI00197E9C1E|nr:sensor histidine kinase [Novosphingobium terrae]
MAEFLRFLLSRRLLCRAYCSLLVLTLTLICTGAGTAQAGQSLEELRHTRWTVGDGAPANIMAIAQTPDGFLWLGTATGLYRFDGIRFEHVEPSDRDPARSLQVTALLAASNGDLWVGYDYGGIGRYRHGRLLSANDRVPKGSVIAIEETRDGRIWFVSRSALGPLLRYNLRGKWHWYEPGADIPLQMLMNAMPERDGSLLVVSGDSALRIAPNTDKPVEIATDMAIFPAFAQGKDGRIWVADNRSLRLLDGTGGRLPLSPVKLFYQKRRLLVDHGGNLWITGQEKGLVRITAEALAKIKQGNSSRQIVPGFEGISGGVSESVYEDREGNVWVGSEGGLDRFVSADVNIVSDVPAPVTRFFQKEPGATVYFGGGAALYKLGEARRNVEIAEKLPGIIGNGCIDRDGRVLVITTRTMAQWSSGRTVNAMIERPDHVAPTACAPDGRGGWWFSVVDDLYEWHEGRISLLHGAITGLSHATLMRSPMPGDLLSYRALQGLKLLHGGVIKNLWQGRDIPVGFIKTITPDARGMLIGGEHGLARFDGKKFEVLDDRSHPFFANVSGILTTAEGSTWIISSQGIVRILSKDLDAAFKSPASPILAFSVGHDQGIRARSNGYDMGDIAQDRQGLLWFATNRGLAWLDPRYLQRNELAPPVTIRTLTANGQSVPLEKAELVLPAGTQHISIEYTALSLKDAVANQFRYRLTGIDGDWITAGDRRQADYNSLRPGTYRFQVIAANGDGVWNYNGAVLNIVIEPFYYQTWWFKAGLVLLVLILLAGIVRWRVNSLAEKARNRVEAQLEERERIARELHDTLLQGVQGLVMRFQAVSEILPPESKAKTMIVGALERSDDIMVESRERVRNLRGQVPASDLVVRLRSIIAEGSASMLISGNPRDVRTVVADELVAIVAEALSNASRHANARQVTVLVDYRFWSLTVEIADDGTGVDPLILKQGSRDGHFGFIGMRERAGRLRSNLEIKSGVGQGTRVSLRVPGRVAYLSRWRRSEKE